MVLIAPFGVMSGFLTVAVAYQLSQAGIPVERVAGLVALSFLPHTWKFLWAPIADTTLGRKPWYLIAATLSALGIFATGLVPATSAGLALLTAVVVVANVAVTFLGMAVESLMAYDTPENEKGRAAGWFQAGNLGGSGLGGGLGLWLAQNLPQPWMAGAILGALCLTCALGLLLVPEPAASHRSGGFVPSLAGAVGDLWGVIRSRRGALALILCFLPIGSGAASGLWSAVAKDWSASANTVALVTGVFAGVLSAIGCILGGWICDRMDRKRAYIAFGVLQAACAVAMAIAPRTPVTYVAFTSVYAVIMGLTYAGFSAFVLEAMGLGAAATKYNVYASLSNMPIAYVTAIDGWAHRRFGPAGMLFVEAAVATAGMLVFAAVLAVVSRRVARPA
jgi:MFS family permease